MKILIFSIGAIGRLFYRKYKDDKQYEIIAFIDNDTNLEGQFYDDKPIYNVDKSKELEFDYILIGGVHFEAMKKQLLDLGIDENKIKFIPDTSITYADDTRTKDVDNIVKSFCNVMKKEGIKYYLIASSLLCVLRGDDLSKVSDVDIMLDSKEDLKKVYKIFKKYEDQLGVNINNYLVETETSFLNKGDSSFVTISSNISPVISEPAMIDLNILFESNNHRFYRLDDSYIYFDKKYFEETIELEYKDFKIPVPKMYDEYLTETYGKNYIIPPKKWSEDDFITLVYEEELLRVIS